MQEILLWPENAVRENINQNKRFFPQQKAMKHIWLFDMSGSGSTGAEPEEVGQPHWPGSHNQHALLECASPHNSVPGEAENGKQTAKKAYSFIYFLSFFFFFGLTYFIVKSKWVTISLKMSAFCLTAITLF